MKLFLEREMYSSVYKLLRKRYPANKGWEILSQYQSETKTYKPDFLVKKGTKMYIHKYIFEVKSENRIKKRHIQQINSYSSKLSGPNVKIKKFLVVPALCNTSYHSDLLQKYHIKVIHLRKFRIIDRFDNLSPEINKEELNEEELGENNAQYQLF